MAAIKANYMTAEEAVKLIKSHDRVYIQGSTSIPEVLLDALTARGHELEGVEMYSAFAIGRRDAPYAVHELRDAFIPRSLFIANCLRNAVARGEAQAIPGFLGQIPEGWEIVGCAVVVTGLLYYNYHTGLAEKEALKNQGGRK